MCNKIKLEVKCPCLDSNLEEIEFNRNNVIKFGESFIIESSTGKFKCSFCEEETELYIASGIYNIPELKI